MFFKYIMLTMFLLIILVTYLVSFGYGISDKTIITQAQRYLSYFIAIKIPNWPFVVPKYILHLNTLILQY